MREYMSREFTQSHDSSALIESMYTVAYWMTGEEATAGLLLGQIYDIAPADASADALFNTAYSVYLNRYCDESEVGSATSKFAVLLSDALEYDHAFISRVLDLTLSEVREALALGRKLFSQELVEVLR